MPTPLQVDCKPHVEILGHSDTDMVRLSTQGQSVSVLQCWHVNILVLYLVSDTKEY